MPLSQADAAADHGGITANFDERGFKGYVRAGLLFLVNDRSLVVLGAGFGRGFESHFDPADGSDSLDGDFDPFDIA